MEILHGLLPRWLKRALLALVVLLVVAVAFSSTTAEFAYFMLGIITCAAGVVAVVTKND